MNTLLLCTTNQNTNLTKLVCIKQNTSQKLVTRVHCALDTSLCLTAQFYVGTFETVLRRSEPPLLSKLIFIGSWWCWCIDECVCSIFCCFSCCCCLCLSCSSRSLLACSLISFTALNSFFSFILRF